MLPWIHPHLAQSVDPHKGRQLQASATIRRGEVVLIDPPYAIIPVVIVDKNKATLLCSNPQCNSPVPVTQSTNQPGSESGQGATCPNRCSPDVLWCHDVCRLTDKARHDFECTWLSRFSRSIRSKWGEYNFGMLWLIVRLLARRHTEHLHLLHHEKTIHLASPLNRFKANWPAMQSLCGTPDTWSNAQVREWTLLVRKYLSAAVLPHDLSNDAVLGLICQEEANSFGLYPRETGVYPPPPPNPSVNRGDQFGAAVYPRASIANHSCCPNVRIHPHSIPSKVLEGS